jgi:hypothetical protein
MAEITSPESNPNPVPAPEVQEPSGFFQEDNGTYSSMRLMCFVGLLAAITFGLLTILGKSDNGNGIYITFGFLLSAFAPKAVQKFAEQKVPAMGTRP